MCAGFEFARVFQAPALQGEQLRLGDFRDHPGQFFLHHLMAGERPVVELLAQYDVGAGGFVAIHRRADHAPADAVARLREAGKRGFEAFGAGQHGGFGHAAIAERKAGGDGSAHGPLAVDQSDVSKPGVPRSIRKPRMPSGVRTQTTATSATEPFVIQVFSPLSTQ